MDQGNWSVIDVGEVPLENGKTGNRIYSSYNIAFDPDDSNTFYIGTWFEGIYKISGIECVGHYTSLNSPLSKGWAMAVPNIVFDRDGNLWIAHAGDVGVSMLPKAKQSIDTDELKASDWYQFGYSEIKNNKYAKLLIPNHSTAKWVVYGDWPGSIFAFDDKGTYNTIADDRTKNIVSFMDQDNKTFTRIITPA